MSEISMAKKTNKISTKEKDCIGFFNNIPIGLYRTTPDGRILMANPALVAMLGYESFHDLCNINLEEKGFDEDYPRTKFKEIMEEEGKVSGRETLWVKKDGSHAYFRESAVAIKDESGRIVYYDGSVEDITQKKLAVDDLQNREKFLSILNDINARALEVNATEELFAFMAEKLTELVDSDHCYITLWDDKNKKTLPHYASHMNVSEYRNKRKTNHERTMTQSVLEAEKALIAEDVFNSEHLSRSIAEQFPNKSLMGIPLIAHKTKLGAVLVGYNQPHTFTKEEIYYADLAARHIALILAKTRSVEELAISEQKLRKLNAEKDKLFSIISHDLRSPFSSILGLTEILSEESEDLSKEQIAVFAGSIHETASNLYKLIDNLLTWSNLQRKEFKPVPTALQLHLLFNEVMQTLGPVAQQKNIAIHQEIEKDLWMKSDTNMLLVVIRNLLSNAIKFSHRGQSIHIKAASAHENHVQIECIDQGVGMTEARLKNLFTIDESESSPGTEKEKGTGLGLLLCKEFVVKLGGSIQAESKLNKGSKFIVLLPKQ